MKAADLYHTLAANYSAMHLRTDDAALKEAYRVLAHGYAALAESYESYERTRGVLLGTQDT